MFGIIKGVAKHSVIYGAADLLSKAIGFVMIPLYTYYLTTADYGALELLDLASYIVSMFMGLGIGQAVFRFYHNYDDEKKKHQVITVSMVTLWLVTLVILFFLVMFSKQISTLVFSSREYYVLLNIVFVTVVLQLANRIPRAFIRIQNKSILFVSISLVRLVLALFLNILFIVYYGMGIKGILYSSLIVSALSFVFMLGYILKYIKLSYSFEVLKDMLKYSIPIMWSWFGMYVLHYGDRFLLQRMASLSDVGIYSLAYKFGMLPNILIMAPFMMMWAPKRFELLKEENAPEIYSTIFTYFAFIQIYLGLGIIVLIKDVISVIADAKFYEAHHYVPMILIAYVICGVFTYVQFGIHVAKKTRAIAVGTLMGAGLNLAVNFVLIPHIQIWGAAIATLVAWLFLLLYIYFPSQRFYYIPYEYGRVLKMVVGGVVLWVIASIINPANVFVSLAVKFFIAFSFPFVLYFMHFYTNRELEKLSQIIKEVVNFTRSKWRYIVAKF